MIRFILLTLFTIFSFNRTIAAPWKYEEDALRKEEETLSIQFAEYAKFYDLLPGETIKDITEDLLKSSCVKEDQKNNIQKFKRRIFIFTYPSDGLKIKALISFVPGEENPPLLVLLRGGTGLFGILNPAEDLMCLEKYTIVASMYRGGVSEGIDEYGGEDVNDVKNLIVFLPELQKKLEINFLNNKKFLLGKSRGSMQMFLALARFPYLQDEFSKIVSLTGLLDMRQSIATRPDMEEFFTEQFGFKKGINEDEWINRRDPILTMSLINKTLPILIIQGGADNRVNLDQGYNMYNKLKSAEKNVTYLEIESGNHSLLNNNRSALILNWLEQ